MSRRKAAPDPHPHLCKALQEVAQTLTAAQLCQVLQYVYALPDPGKAEDEEQTP